jgi:hypothetical protein
MLPRRAADTDGDNLAMAVDDGSLHQRTSVSDTTVDLPGGVRMGPSFRAVLGR